jgi:hypothetical protein
MQTGMRLTWRQITSLRELERQHWMDYALGLWKHLPTCVDCIDSWWCLHIFRQSSAFQKTRPLGGLDPIRELLVCVQGAKQKIITVVCPTWSHSPSIYLFIYIYISNPVFLWSQYCLSYIGLLSQQPKVSSLAAPRGPCVEPRRTPERSHSEPFWRNTFKWLSCESEFHSITFCLLRVHADIRVGSSKTTRPPRR